MNLLLTLTPFTFFWSDTLWNSLNSAIEKANSNGLDVKSCSWCSVGHLGIKYIHSHLGLKCTLFWWSKHQVKSSIYLISFFFSTNSEYWSEYVILSLECLNQLCGTKKEKINCLIPRKKEKSIVYIMPRKKKNLLLLIANLHSAATLSILYLRKMRKNWRTEKVLHISLLSYCLVLINETWKLLGKLGKMLHIRLLAQLLWRGQKVAAAHQIQLQHTWQKIFDINVFRKELILRIKAPNRWLRLCFQLWPSLL